MPIVNSYESIEKMECEAPATLTVAYLEQCEKHGEPWPISGDLTRVARAKAACFDLYTWQRELAERALNKRPATMKLDTRRHH